MRLMKDEGGRLKGYGYMDFEDRESLVNALQMSEITMSNRNNIYIYFFNLHRVI